MDVYCRPEHILDAIQLHGVRDDEKKTDSFESKDKKIISSWFYTIDRMSPSQRTQYRELFSPEDITRVAEYVSDAKAATEQEYYYDWLREAASQGDWRILYRGWLNGYERAQLSQMVLGEMQDNQHLLAALDEMHVPKDILRRLLEHLDWDYLLTAGRTCETEAAYQMRLRDMGIFADTLLYSDASKKYYMVCREPAYRRADDAKLCDIFDSYSQEEKQIFCANLLKECSIRILDGYKNLFHKINQLLIDNPEGGFREFLNQQGVDVEYSKWTNYATLDAYMQNYRSRSEFWKRYIGNQEVTSVPKARALYIDFGDYVYVDQIQWGSGYLYSKAYFEEEIKAHILRMDSRQLIRYQREIYEYNRKARGIIRFRYIVGWQVLYFMFLRRVHILPLESNN